ncbi:MAG: hypothetical protein E7016_02070 [Alphaproteobacteria bacterium]|nr:hypothetical protein [Alphaproteobacteria bacterium]
MKKMKKLSVLALMLVATGCAYNKNHEPVYEVLPYQESMIGLQNLQNRVVVYCYHSDTYTAEQCADYFENMDFIRLNDIPKFTAEYDSLKADTYPTRRWRKDERIPRW